MTPLEEIEHLIHTLDPQLIKTSDYRPNASFHSLHLASDWWHKDIKRLYLVFMQLAYGDWPGGVSIGVDTADRHLHIDARHKCNPPGLYQPVAFIETKPWDGTSCGEVCRWKNRKMTTRELLKWDAMLLHAKRQYGLI